MNREPDIPVLWCDEHLLIVDKPAGLPTLPDGWAAGAPCLVGLLSARYGRLWIVHRLDRGTSGVLALARTATAHRHLNLQFDARQVHKVYHALVVGKPTWDTIVADMPLRSDGDRRHRTVVDEQRGKPARTHLRVLERFLAAALLEAQPETGRTHQIRAHLAALGLPLLGDQLYGGASPAAFSSPVAGDVLMDRPALHAWALAFSHPATGQPITVQAPYPPDFAAALAKLRAGG